MLLLKSVEELQSSLYQTAKANKKSRFYSLHDNVLRIDILHEAWNGVKENRGKSGVDKQIIAGIEDGGVEQFLSELQHELFTNPYKIEYVNAVFIPKRRDGMRLLGIPTVKDRLVQQAVKLKVEPIFEANFQGFRYGCRHGRSAKQASAGVCK